MHIPIGSIIPNNGRIHLLLLLTSSPHHDIPIHVVMLLIRRRMLMVTMLVLLLLVLLGVVVVVEVIEGRRVIGEGLLLLLLVWVSSSGEVLLGGDWGVGVRCRRGEWGLSTGQVGGFFRNGRRNVGVGAQFSTANPWRAGASQGV